MSEYLFLFVLCDSTHCQFTQYYFDTLGLRFGGKHHGSQQRTGSEITDSTRPKKPQNPTKKLYDQRNIKT